MAEEEKSPEKEKRRRIRYYEEGKKDLRYRGPLSYRVFKILGWLCIAAAQVALLMRIDMRMEPEMETVFRLPYSILNGVSTMSVPLLLIANFALILNASEGYHRQLIRYGLTLSLVAGLSILVYYRYLVGAAAVLLGDRTMASILLEESIVKLLPTHFIAYNLFIDLFLCSLLMFFMHYRPKHVFTGKRVIIFRLFSLLPILYELASIVLKMLAVEEKITLPLLASPFLPVKPPMAFLVFVIMTLFLKHRERKFLRNGRTYEEYQEFLQTNRNSFHFSTFSAVLFTVAAIVDILVTIVFLVVFHFSHPEWSTETAVGSVSALGFGKSSVLLLMAPLMLLFSYTRKHKRHFVDTMIPAGGVILIVLIYLEGAFQFIQYLPMMISYLVNR